MADDRQNPRWGDPAKFMTDASGNVTGILKPQTDQTRAPVPVWDASGARALTTPTGGKMAIPRTFPVDTLRIGVFGDSIMDYRLPLIYGTGDAVDNGNGTATITKASNGIPVGTRIKVNSSATAALNCLNTAVVSSDSSGITYTINTPNTGKAGGGAVTYALLDGQDNRGFVNWARHFLGGRLDVVADCAVGGFTMSEALALAPSIFPGIEMDFVVNVSGTNDAVSQTLATMQTREIATCDYFESLGIPIIRALVPPRTHTDGSWSAAVRNRILEFNDWLRYYIPTRGGRILDTWTASISGKSVADFSDTTYGDYASGMSSDGIHPQPMAAAAWGRALANILSPYVGGRRAHITHHLDVYAQNPRQKVDNPGWTGTGGTKTAGSGTITGNVPDGWTLTINSGTATVAVSTVARTVANDGDCAGNNLRLAITGATSSQITLSRTTGGSGYRSRFTVGESYEFCFTAKISSGSVPGSGNPVGLDYLYGYTNMSVSPYGNWGVLAGNNTGGLALAEGVGPLVFRSNAYRLDAAGTADTTPRIVINFDSTASGEATIDLAFPSITKVG